MSKVRLCSTHEGSDFYGTLWLAVEMEVAKEASVRSEVLIVGATRTIFIATGLNFC
jgi:hypothetical protein